MCEESELTLGLEAAKVFGEKGALSCLLQISSSMYGRSFFVFQFGCCMYVWHHVVMIMVIENYLLEPLESRKRQLSSDVGRQRVFLEPSRLPLASYLVEYL